MARKTQEATNLHRESEALRRSEERSRALLEHTSESVFCYEYDPPIPTDLPVARQVEMLYEGVLVECNDHCARSYGSSHAAEVIGKRLAELFGTSSGRLDALFEAFVTGGYQMRDGEGEEVLPDGSRRYFLNSAHGVVQNGKLRQVWGAFRDITAIKSSELASREREALLGAILECIPFDFFALDPNGRYVLQNSRCRANWGPIIGKHPADVAWSPDVLDLWEHNNQRAIDGEIVDCEITMETAGETRHFRNIVAPAREGDRTHCIFGVNIDITSERTAEAMLRNSEERFRLFFEHAPVYCYMVAPDGTMLAANAAARACLGCAEEELVGRHVGTIYAEESQQRIAALLERWPHTSDLRDEELVIVTKDGQRRQVLLSATAIRDDRGEIQSSISVQIDVTERRQAAAEKATLQEQLIHAQKMEAIGTLAGGLAHDLNNSLMGVVGLASVMKLRSSPDSPTARDAEIIEKAGRRAFEMTEQLLGFARKSKPLARRIDLLNTVGRVVAILKHTIPKNIEIRSPDPQTSLAISGDPGQLEQVIMNLAVNARDAMPDGGVLGFTLEELTVSQQPSRTVPGLAPGRYAVVAVSDQGGGIPEGVRSRVFEPFFTTKDAGRGTGMGLAMAYSIVRDHGGALAFESTPDVGTVFRVFLPIAEGGATQRSEKTTDHALFGSGTILLVDDEEIVREVAERMLKVLGYEVLLAESGEQALEIYSTQSQKVDLIVLDMMMPGMSGQDCFRELTARNPGVRILFSSGNAPPDASHQPCSENCVGFIQKPYTIKVLSQAIATAIGENAEVE
ncbi:MAG: PAS domain S-box protein [bacterium]|nr:PAS domain S-box protein [bacterium]